MENRPLASPPAQLLFSDGGFASPETTYHLAQLDVYNWGPFRGLHRAEFDQLGTAIIGPTGSGKTTLVDALMTLLVAQPRYNLASTGGHESDRTLMSYVRGVLGGDGSDGHEEVSRPGKTLTGVCATYHGGEKTLRLAALIWTDGPSNSAADLRRRWLFSLADDQSLETWLRLLHDEGVRELMRHGRETSGLRVFESKKSYLAHTRKFFALGDNAFTLLNRAAGLKQLNSIDELFRELVLDDNTAFDRALEVAAEFDNLAQIHKELEIARQQRESLAPVALEHQKVLKSRAKAARTRALQQALPTWFALQGRERWSQVLDQIHDEQGRLRACLGDQQQEEAACRRRAEALRERYLQLGGNVIGELENTIKSQRTVVADRRKHADNYQLWARKLELDDVLNQATLARNQALLDEKRRATQRVRDRQHEQTLVAYATKRDAEQELADIEAALQKVRDRPGSNIPPRFQDFRSELAERLALTEDDLPFLAEMVEVKPDQSSWRGAIERAIGSERLRVLVPAASVEAALRWVNHRDNRLHVRLQSARSDDSPGEGFADGFTQKLTFKEHPLGNTARRLLAARDLHCVASAAELRTVEHGLTIEGMTSGRRGRFEKQDQRRLQDDWMTGFDNQIQLQSLADRREAVQANIVRMTDAAEAQRQELSTFDERLVMIDQVSQLDFATIDLPGAEAELAHSEQRMAMLLDPDSDASRAKSEYDSQAQMLDRLQAAVRETESKIAVQVDRQSRAEQRLQAAQKRIGAGLDAEALALAEKHCAILPQVTADELDAVERDTKDAIDRRLSEQTEAIAHREAELVRRMEAARRVDTGALADVGSEIDDVPAYLDRLRVLNEEALPEKRQRFLEYLNRSSDQGVTQMLAGVQEEVDAIDERIKELNQTLVKVDFRSGRYLQLLPERIKHERLRALEAAMRKVRSATLKDDEGESHYKALRELVEILRDAGENRRQQGSKALLDPRYRLQFFVVEVDRQTGAQSPRRTGSQSGSGGEKELMASHILTASLSYALCPPEASRPLYGTVVLDEAFSKSSPSAAGRIIEALRVFHLSPVFVTPNKEIGLLKQHTRRVICVQRPQKEATLAAISWERLEEAAAAP